MPSKMKNFIFKWIGLFAVISGAIIISFGLYGHLLNDTKDYRPPILLWFYGSIFLIWGLMQYLLYKPKKTDSTAEPEPASSIKTPVGGSVQDERSAPPSMTPLYQFGSLLAFWFFTKLGFDAYEGLLCFRENQCVDTTQKWQLVTPMLWLSALVFLFIFVKAVYNDWKK
jgi:uncharacterized membrane protein